MRLAIGVPLMCVGFGLALFIVAFGLLPAPQMFSTPLPIVAAAAALIGLAGIWVLRGSRVTRRAKNAQAVTLISDGPQPLPKRLLQIVGLIVIGLAAPLILFGIIGTSTPSTSAFAWGCIYTGIALVGAFWGLLALRKSMGKASFHAASLQLPAAHQHCEDGAGVALSADGRMLLASGSLRRAYSLADVRSIDFDHSSPSLQLGRGASGAILTQTLKADASNGMSIQMRDTRHPLWHIPMRNKADVLRWREILQAASES